MDMGRALPKSRAGYRYILVICECSTRHPEVIPLRSLEAEHAVEELKRFARVGIPREILTDQGSNFISQFLKEVYSLLYVQPIQTSHYRPHTDRLAERFNQTLMAILQ